MACDHDNGRNKFTIFTIGSKVEISSDEPGFEGAWYVATLVDVDVHNPKTKNENGFLVKYDTLLKNNNINEKLTEVVDGKFLRPLPPPEYNGSNGFEVGDVIDAYYRDGWWIGVVVEKVMKDNDEEDDKYVVCFKNPYEEVEFDKFQLRIHVDWIDSCWKILPKKMLKKLIRTPKKLKSYGKNVAQTSESNYDFLLGFTTPSKGPGDSVHTSCRSTGKRTRSQKRATQKKPKLAREIASLTSESIDNAELGFTTPLKGPVTTYKRTRSQKRAEASEAVNGLGRKEKRGKQPKLAVVRDILQQGTQKTRKRYVLRDMSTDLDDIPLSCWYKRPHSHSVPKRCSSNSPCGHRNGSNGRQNQINVDESNGPQNQTNVAESNCPQNQTNVNNVNESIGPLNQTNINNADESNDPQNQTNVDESSGPVQNQTNVNNDDESNGPQNQTNVNNGDESSGPQNQTNVNIGDESSGPQNQTNMENGVTGDYQQQWPFIKQSSLWAIIESMESYKITPQKPHFTPLKESKELLREGFAIGFASTFAYLVRKVKSLQLTDPNELINDSLEVLVELESHGFDVQLVRDRLNALLTRKVNVGQLQEKLDKIKKDIEKCNLDRSVVEEETGQYDDEIGQLEAKIRELKERVVQNSKTLSLKDEEINKMQVDVDRVSNQIMDWKIAFEKLAASPFTATNS